MLNPVYHIQESIAGAPVEWVQSESAVDYATAMTWMQQRATAIRNTTAKECIWMLEHPPLYTAGTSAAPEELLDAGDLPVIPTGRGGKYTYHGPGQRIAYVMLDVAARGGDLRKFVWTLEEWVIRALADLGVRGQHRAGWIGVWVEVDGRVAKIAALGLRVRRWVTTHGIAINVCPELSRYRGIIPCGIQGCEVTSLHELGNHANISELDTALARQLPALVGDSPVANAGRIL